MSIINTIINNYNINQIDNDGNTLLHILVLYNKTNHIIELLKHNPNIIYKNKKNVSPLCIAEIGCCCGKYPRQYIAVNESSTRFTVI